MKKYHDVSGVSFVGGYLVLTVDGEERKFKLKEVSAVLENASDLERCTFEISPSGYGIHWPLLDEDISINALIGITHSPQWERKIA